MFDSLKQRQTNAQLARQQARCKTGEHAWVLMSEDTVTHVDDNAPHGASSYITTKFYRCRGCGQEKIEKVGGPGGYATATEFPKF